MSHVPTLAASLPTIMEKHVLLEEQMDIAGREEHAVMPQKKYAEVRTFSAFPEHLTTGH